MTENDTANDSRLLDVVKTAWDELWKDVCACPNIIRWHESNALVHFGHRILGELEKEDDLKPWTNVIPIFDEAESLRDSGIVIWCAFGRRLRPDILVKRRDFKENAINGIVIELKCIRSIYQDYMTDTAEGTLGKKKRPIYGETGGVLEDIERLKEFANLQDAKSYRAIMCVLHLHDPKWGEAESILPKLAWPDLENVDGLIVRRTWQVYEPSDELDFLN